MKQNNHIDGWLYVGVAVCAALTASLGSDEAAKFYTPEYLFKLKTICGAVGAGLLAGKMYRSTTYATSVATNSDLGVRSADQQAVPTPSAATTPAKVSQAPGASNLPAQVQTK